MPFDLNIFKASGMKLGGARPTQFEVSVTPPFQSPNTSRIKFFVRAASLPEMPYDSIPVPYFGRKIQFNGDRDYPPWNVTVMNDEDFPVRMILERWSNLMNKIEANVMDASVFPTTYKQTAHVTQYSKNGDVIRVVNFIGIFPLTVGAIPLDWDQTNAIEQFDCSFAFDFWEPDEGGGSTFQGGGTAVTLPDDYSGNIKT